MKCIQQDSSSFEDESRSIYVQIDDICCKEQKANRNQEGAISNAQKMEEKRLEARKKGRKPYTESKYLFQTVTYLSKGLNDFHIVTKSMDKSLSQMITAFIKATKSQDDNLIFLTDGMRSLHSYIRDEFRNKPYTLLLDWYHLAKKVTSQLMMGMKKSESRANIESKIKKFLWYGLTNQAKETINKIAIDQVKKQKYLDLLIGYIERNKNIIPNYAIRKKLELKNSTSRVEKANDNLIAQRQKRNGMSWSKDGSHSLAILKSLKLNNQFSSYHFTNKYQLKWA